MYKINNQQTWGLRLSTLDSFILSNYRYTATIFLYLNLIVNHFILIY